MKNHKYSEKAKYGQCKESKPPTDLKVGDFVHLKEERDKHKLRDRYLVKNILSGEATILKLLHSEDSNTATTISRKEITVQLENIYKADNFNKVKHQYTVPVEKKKNQTKLTTSRPHGGYFLKNVSPHLSHRLKELFGLALL